MFVFLSTKMFLYVVNRALGLRGLNQIKANFTLFTYTKKLKKKERTGIIIIT